MVAGAWALAALLLATQAWVSGAVRGAPVAWASAFAIWGCWAALWALLTPLSLNLFSTYPLERPGRVRAALTHGVAGLGFSALNLALFALVAPYVGATAAGPDWWSTFSRLLGSTFLLNVPVYWLIVGSAQAARFARAARDRERRALQLEAQLSEARLVALRSQLEPHFLFNALNTVSVLMREDVEAADRVLVQLSGLLRRALDVSSSGEVPLRVEIAFLEAYLAIEKARFTDRLTYGVDIDEEALGAQVPSLILQPLVENAVRHGLAASPSPGRIDIGAERRGSALHLTVRDSGPGIPPGIAPGARDGVGIANTRARLQLLFGGQHTFEFSGPPEGGFVVSLSFPWRVEVSS